MIRSHVLICGGTGCTSSGSKLIQNAFAQELEAMGFRVDVDYRNEKIGKKIREATMAKVPYMLVVGDRDMENGTVSPRHRSGEDLGAMTFDAFAAMLKEVVDSKAKK